MRIHWLLGLLAFLAVAASPVEAADGISCSAVSEVPANFQVAWISPVRQRVRAGKWMDVIRVADLRTLARDFGRDQTRLLQALGIVGPKGPGVFTPRRWKVTLFDIQADWLCRPVDGGAGMIDGVPACRSSQQRSSYGYTGCGYAGDSISGSRGPDIFRIQWKEAARWGFCVMPLERFIAGA